MIEFTEVDAPQPRSAYQHTKKYRKTAKGRASRNRATKAKRYRDYLKKRFVAWDGEGVTRKAGKKQDYVLLACSDGDSITNTTYLGSREIFEFLLDTVERGTINVIYGAGYDWNMWVRDLPRETLEALYRTGACTWGDYWIKWRPGKTFHLGIRGDKKRTALFYDVVSFFQRPFIKACDEYLGDDFRHRDMIVKNKANRSTFTDDDIDEVKKYCDAELENLVMLMNELRARLDRVGLRVTRWDGPGAVAVALFGEHNVKDHLERTPRFMSLPVRSAYYGGRFEVIKTGYVDRDVYEYDVNSAYPWALQDVSSMAGGTWRVVHGDEPGHDFALYHVTFRGDAGMCDKPYPLPFRFESGSVAYPQETTGWYWGPEIAVARQYCERYGGTLTVHETRVFEPATEKQPFRFIGPLYTQRRILKDNGDGAHVGIKLGLNSMYGKLAQQVGWSETKKGLRLPPYHQLEWAGYVTSRCRAAVLGAVIDDLSCVVAFETDAMFTTKKLDVPEGKNLGQWEYTRFSDMIYLQSGTYFAHSDGKLVEKTRGVDRGEMTRDDAYRALSTNAETIPARLTRFNGIGIALAQRFEKWLVWETMTKNVAVHPHGKRAHLPEACVSCDRGFSMGVWHGTYPAPSLGAESLPFPIEWEEVTAAGRELARLRRENIARREWDD